MALPELPTNIGKSGTLKIPPDGKVLRFKIVDEIRRAQSDLPEKIIVLQRIEFEGGKEEFRLGYYVIGKRPKMKGKWVWGQFATFLPKKDFVAVFREAEKRGWF